MRPQTFQIMEFSWFFAKHRVSFQLFLTIWQSSFDTHAPARAASQLRTESSCNSRSIEPDVYTRNEWEPWKCATFEENIILFFCEHKHYRHDHGGPVSAKYQILTKWYKIFSQKWEQQMKATSKSQFRSGLHLNESWRASKFNQHKTHIIDL